MEDTKIDVTSHVVVVFFPQPRVQVKNNKIKAKHKNKRKKLNLAVGEEFNAIFGPNEILEKEPLIAVFFSERPQFMRLKCLTAGITLIKTMFVGERPSEHAVLFVLRRSYHSENRVKTNSDWFEYHARNTNLKSVNRCCGRHKDRCNVTCCLFFFPQSPGRRLKIIK